MRPDRERMINEFKSLASIDSESRNERRMADALIGKLKTMGFEVIEDDTGKKIGGNAGNLYAVLPGDPEIEPVLFSAHMDTVKPGSGKQAVVAPDGKITGNGKAVLGADDLNGICEILEGIRLVIESGQPHGDIEILFAAAEETYAEGSSNFDFGRIRSKTAYVLDMSEPVGKAAFKAPSIISFRIRVKGRAAHAGFNPEKGKNAILTAARAVSRLEFGHVGDGETTFNIGEIEGGAAPNIVPQECVLRGEVRGYVHEIAMEQVEKAEKVFEEEAERTGCSIECENKVHIYAYEIGKDEYVCRRFISACEQAGIPVPEGGRFRTTFGGSDNNNFTRHGIRGIVLGNGMKDSHSVQENTTAGQLLQGAKLVAALILEDGE